MNFSCVWEVKRTALISPALTMNNIGHCLTLPFGRNLFEKKMYYELDINSHIEYLDHK